MLLRRKIDRYLYEQKRNKETKQQQQQQAAPAGRQGGATNYGHLSDRPEADQNIRCKYNVQDKTRKEVQMLPIPCNQGRRNWGARGPPQYLERGAGIWFRPPIFSTDFSKWCQRLIASGDPYKSFNQYPFPYVLPDRPTPQSCQSSCASACNVYFISAKVLANKDS